MSTNNIFAWLLSHGADKQPHGKRMLLDHLVGVEALLIKACAPEEIQIAGLCHSIYGTTSYRRSLVSIDKRQEVQNLIGERSERLVYEFCTINRPQCLFNGNYGGRDIFALIQIEIANLMEQGQLDRLSRLIYAA